MNISALSLNTASTNSASLDDEILYLLGSFCGPILGDLSALDEKERTAIEEYRMRRLCDRIQLAICYLHCGGSAGSGVAKMAQQNLVRLVHLYSLSLPLIPPRFRNEAMWFASAHCTGIYYSYIIYFIYLFYFIFILEFENVILLYFYFSSSSILISSAFLAFHVETVQFAIPHVDSQRCQRV
jgi:hypothetical protein